MRMTSFRGRKIKESEIERPNGWNEQKNNKGETCDGKNFINR